MAKQVSPGVLALRKVVDDVYADAREAKKQGKQMCIRDRYQIAKSKEGAETLRVTVAGRFSAAPRDRAHVSGTKLGLAGEFRVIECVRRFGESRCV